MISICSWPVPASQQISADNCNRCRPDVQPVLMNSCNGLPVGPLVSQTRCIAFASRSGLAPLRSSNPGHAAPSPCPAFPPAPIPSSMLGVRASSARMQRTASPKPTPFRALSREIVLQHRTVADLALTQSFQRLVDLGHGEHLHHQFDAVAGAEVERACDRGRRTREGTGNLLLPQDQGEGLHRNRLQHCTHQV